MPQGSLRVVKSLSNLSVMYKNAEYIAPQFMPEIPVTKDTDKYFIYNQNFRIEKSLRADKSEAKMVTFDCSTSSYVANRHSLKDGVSAAERMNSDLPGSLDVDVVENLTDALQRRYEYDVHKLLFTTTTFSNYATLATATSWNYNTITSAPIQNVLSATAKILASSGRRPNTMVTNFAVFASLKENANVYGRIQYVERAIVTSEILASMFDVGNVYVGTAVYDEAAELLGPSLTAIWGGDCLVAYFEKLPGMKKATAAQTFRVSQNGTPISVKKWYDDDRDCDMIEVDTKYGLKAVATSCAYLFKTAAKLMS